MSALDGAPSWDGASGELRVSRQPVVEGDAQPDAVEQEAAKEPEIDLQALASKVYALLRQELRVERERLG